MFIYIENVRAKAGMRFDVGLPNEITAGRYKRRTSLLSQIRTSVPGGLLVSGGTTAEVKQDLSILIGTPIRFSRSQLISWSITVMLTTPITRTIEDLPTELLLGVEYSTGSIPFLGHTISCTSWTVQMSLVGLAYSLIPT